MGVGVGSGKGKGKVRDESEERGERERINESRVCQEEMRRKDDRIGSSSPPAQRIMIGQARAA